DDAQRKLRGAGGARKLSFHYALFDRFDRHSFTSDKFDGRLNVLLLAGEQYGHNANRIVNACLADVKNHVRKLPAHLPDNRLLHFLRRRKCKPASSRKPFAHAIQPPAIAGTMLISSPSFTGVSRFLRKRMSSSLRYTLTNRFNWFGALNKRVS